ncbi:MAG: hypothetical protein OXI05_07875, partial [Bacteroidota bacterium]|nr:hypothetical protein [Bacteroidota bacterium]
TLHDTTYPAINYFSGKHYICTSHYTHSPSHNMSNSGSDSWTYSRFIPELVMFQPYNEGFMEGEQEGRVDAEHEQTN